MLLGAPFAVVLISIIVIVSWRSVKLGIAAAPTATIAFGIEVDNTIHFLSKYLRARRVSGLSAKEAIHYSFHRVGGVLGTTTTILASGFLALTLSAMAPNLFIGLMTALSLVISLALTFCILPTLLIYIDKDESEEEEKEAIRKAA